MQDHRRLQLENKRDAAVARRTKLLADIAAIEAGERAVSPVWSGESQKDARENLLALLQQSRRDEDDAIVRMEQDLAHYDR